jgi:tetratricopeptide (TPR) repeat protein
VEGESLWEFLHHRDDILKDASGKTVIPLLIFDQFEEIFTLAQVDDAGRKRAAQFIEDLADLVENRPPKNVEARLEKDDTVVERFDFSRADYRILIALREDYLAHLESVKGVMPSITQNRMRLARMNGQQALAAVMKPGGKLVTEEVAEAIVRFIAGGAELRNAEVEPSLLSLICRELNNARIAQGRTEISADLLAGSHDTILAEFYERALADQPAAIRKVIEDELLTESGYRENLAEERLLKAFAAAGASPDALATLVNRRLLRIEERLDVRRVELTHDVLCGVVKASREQRLAREAKEAAEQQLAEQKAREHATRKALIRARKIAVGATALAVVAVASAIWGLISTNRAQQAEAKALENRKQAESARTEAEKLVVFLLDDFQLELEPIGRLDIVASLSKRAQDYYAGLPAELRSDVTERNRALAAVRYALSLRNLGRLEEAEKAATNAVAVLGKLRDAGDATEPTLIGLAMGTSALARIQNQQGRFADARKTSGKAYDLIRPLATAPGASVPARRAMGEIAVSHGFNAARDGDFKDAVVILEDSRTALRSIDGLQLGDLNSAALFVEATAWQMWGLVADGRAADAIKSGGEARTVADRLLEKRPGHMMALRARALLLANFGDLENERLRFKASIPFYAAAARDYESLTKVDAGNTISWNNLSGQQNGLGLMTEGTGNPREGLKHLRAAARSASQGGLTPVRAFNASSVWWHIARVEAEQGNHEAARAALAENRRLLELAYSNAPEGSFRRGFLSTFADKNEAAIALRRGDYAFARDRAGEVARRFESLKPETQPQKYGRADNLVETLEIASIAAYMLRDYAAAEAAARRAVEVGKERSPQTNVFEKVFQAEVHALHAMALAKLGRLVEARRALEPAEKTYAAFGDTREAGWIRMRQSTLWLGKALAYPGDSRRYLEEAARAIDEQPAALRQTSPLVMIRNEIAREQAARR